MSLIAILRQNIFYYVITATKLHIPHIRILFDKRFYLLVSICLIFEPELP